MSSGKGGRLRRKSARDSSQCRDDSREIPLRLKSGSGRDDADDWERRADFLAAKRNGFDVRVKQRGFAAARGDWFCGLDASVAYQ